MTIIKVLLQRVQKSQNQVSLEANIPKNRMTELVKGRADPRPDEIAALDKSLKQNRRLVYNYCSTTCPAGKYAGYQFSDMDTQTAGIRLISTLATLDRLIPDLADMICEGRITPEVLAKLSQLRLSIMALEVHLSRDKIAYCSLCDIREFRQKKENATASTVANYQ